MSEQAVADMLPWTGPLVTYGTLAVKGAVLIAVAVGLGWLAHFWSTGR